MLLKQQDNRCKLFNRNVKLTKGFILNEDGSVERISLLGGYGDDGYYVGEKIRFEVKR